MIKTTSNTQNQLGKICRFLKNFFFCDRRKRVSVVYENMLCCSNLPVSGMRTGFRYVHLRTNSVCAKQPLGLLFIDLNKAYDRVDR